MPSTSTWPRIGRRVPAATRSSVVLPAPFGPSSATVLPSGTIRSTSERTRAPVYPADTRRSSSMAGLLDRPEVGLPDAVVAEHRVRRSVAEVHAEVEDVEVGTDLADQRHVVLDDEHRGAR